MTETETQARHTPVPWKLGAEMLTPAGTRAISGPDRRDIAYVYEEADAELIIRAPALLAENERLQAALMPYFADHSRLWCCRTCRECSDTADSIDHLDGCVARAALEEGA